MQYQNILAAEWLKHATTLKMALRIYPLARNQVINASPRNVPVFTRVENTWSAKTDPVRFKWGFGEGRLKYKFAFFEACKNSIPKRRINTACKPPIFISKKGPV